MLAVLVRAATATRTAGLHHKVVSLPADNVEVSVASSKLVALRVRHVLLHLVECTERDVLAPGHDRPFATVRVVSLNTAILLQLSFALALPRLFLLFNLALKGGSSQRRLEVSLDPAYNFVDGT